MGAKVNVLRDGSWSWINEAGVLQRGKYRGDTIDNVANDDEDYCQWLLETVDLTREEESMIEEALGL